MPSGQPIPRASDQLHPLRVTASTPSVAANASGRKRRETR
jgi:hypothetical protein